MGLEIHVETLPLRTNEDGIVYVGSTRVPLETVVGVFNEGATPEEIAIQYPALSFYAYERTEAGKPMPGIVDVKRAAPMKIIIEDILLLIADDRPEDIKDRIIYLPLK